MKHIKKIAIILIIIIVATAAAFIIKRHFSADHDNVTIQGFCLGLCGKDQNGNGFGLGLGASDKGPLIVAGPWGDNN